MSTEIRRTTTHWGTFDFTVHDGRARSTAAPSDNPFGEPLATGLHETLDHPLRITRPHVREGWLERGPRSRDNRRGGEPMVEIEWSEAYDLIAGELGRIRTDHGDEAIFGGSYGWGSAGRFHHAQSQIHRFLNMDGGYVSSRNSYSVGAQEVVLPRVIGGPGMGMFDWSPQWSEIAERGELFLGFGGAPLKNTHVNQGGMRRNGAAEAQRACAEAGVRFVLISPMRADLAPELRAEWIPIRPGTDTAVMLAMAHHLASEGLEDRDFLERCCTGYERFRAYVLGDLDGVPKTPEWAAEISGVPAATTRELAEASARQRTVVSLTWSIQRAQHGEQPYWAGATLAAMTGSMGRPGGGFAAGLSMTNGLGLHRGSMGVASLPQGGNPVRAFIPVARISDMLLNPGESFRYDGELLTYPDIRLVYWAGGNPFHHQQDINKLLRAWNGPETVVVHDSWWTPVARHADIVIPVATPLEREDIAGGSRDTTLLPMRRIQDPPDGVPTDFQAFAQIAERRGFADRFTEGLNADGWVRRLFAETTSRLAGRGVDLPSYDEFVALEDGVEVPLVAGRNVFAELREDPAAHPLDTPSGRIEIFSDTVAGFGYDDCPGHAVWREPDEWLGSAEARSDEGLFHLLSHQPKGRLHSQVDFAPASRATKVGGREPITMHADDARRLGLADGDVVKVSNERGACLAAVRTTDGILPRVAVMATGGWYDPEQPGEPGSMDLQGNPNVLTLDVGTSELAQGSSAQTCLVRIAAYPQAPPSRAYEPPATRRSL
ncbi:MULTISPECIES: molybdopterin-dependent oxidoreductase [Tsukamurella]|uniref:Molybdopterin-dependent oxidoreductase n=1 Tax=Tsukamurella columbiensis TaxID=128509 RepID=A0ABX1LBX9_9ACTN|nr:MULTISPECIES: molybdopterin-dependent oxidoreductase [Tsukamurella]NMD55741.1 molybdopterin-dependent oxidoreductase [Tsukamurella columbiensis]